jgi:hypothetical protein
MLAVGGLLGALPARAEGPTKQECVAANDAAQDLRMQHKLHAAREKLLLCAAQGCPGPVREDCAARLAELDKAMPTVVFEVLDAAGNDVSAVRVSVDGQRLADSLDGGAIALDPGEHRLAFDAEGRPAVDKTIVLREGEKDHRVRVVLADAGSPEQHHPAMTPAASGAESAPSNGSGQRTLGLIVGGAGVAGVIVGGVFGLMAKSTYDQVSQVCRDRTGPCSAADATHGSDAHGQAGISTGAVIVGGGLLAAGVVVYLTAPRAGVTLAPSVGTSGAGLRVEASW